MLGSLVEITPAAVAVVSAADAKRYLHGVAADETDADLEALVAAATEYAETWLGQQLVNATFDLLLPGFAAEIELTPPLSSVTTVKYYDTSNAIQTLAAASYEVDLKHRPGRVCPAYGYTWPSTYDRYDAVAVRFVCGYGAAAANVPANIILAIKALVAHWYEYRGTVITGTIVADVPRSVERLLNLSAHGAYA